MRTCVACRSVKPKRELVRIVRTPQGEVRADASGKMNGRGAYVCLGDECSERALGAPLARALGVSPSEGEIEELRKVLERLEQELSV